MVHGLGTAERRMVVGIAAGTEVVPGDRILAAIGVEMEMQGRSMPPVGSTSGTRFEPWSWIGLRMNSDRSGMSARSCAFAKIYVEDRK